MPDFPEVSQARLARALSRLGLTVDKKKGKGGHYKVFASNGKWTIIPPKLKAKGTRCAIAKFLIEQGIDFDTFLKDL